MYVVSFLPRDFGTMQRIVEFQCPHQVKTFFSNKVEPGYCLVGKIPPPPPRGGGVRFWGVWGLCRALRSA